MGIQIRLEGLDEVIGKLNRMANGANSGLQRGLMQGGELVRAEAAANCPVDTGALRQSIVVEAADGTSVTVGTNLEYGIYVEFGTGSHGDSSVAHTSKGGWVYFNEKTGSFVYTTGQPPQPFLVPALFSQQSAVVEAVKAGLLSAL